MHTAAKRRQRKNLRLPVVLVHDSRRLVGGRDRLQVHHNSVTANARVPFLHAIPVDQTTGHRKHCAPVEAGRLDAAVRARRQRRLSRVQRHRARFVASTGNVPQQKLDSQDGGRVMAAVAAS